jgi:hypothetical protein
MPSSFVADAILLIVGLVKLVNSKNLSIDKDTLERISLFIKLLTSGDKISSDILLLDTKENFDDILKTKEKKRKELELFVRNKQDSLFF